VLPDERHFKTVAGAIRDGDVVPVLGAGANLCDRKLGDGWARGKTLPNGSELSLWLASHFGTIVDDPRDLLRVASAVALARGPEVLHRELHAIFAPDYEPTTLHGFLARLPKLREEHGLPAQPQLIVSTNYDDLLEQAFIREGVPFDLVYYLAQGELGTGKDLGRFVHVSARERTVIRAPRSYLDVAPNERTVILKIHGSVRPAAEEDSWVISEDDYVEYLTRTNLSQLFPAGVLPKLLKSNLLFLGYAMNDWNLRVILHRICTARNSNWPAWAIQLHADDLDKELWDEKNVDIYCVPLSDYVTELSACLQTMIEC